LLREGRTNRPKKGALIADAMRSENPLMKSRERERERWVSTFREAVQVLGALKWWGGNDQKGNRVPAAAH